MTTHYNTTGLRGVELLRANLEGAKQQEGVLLIYEQTKKQLSPWEVCNVAKEYGQSYWIGSVRRCITDLTTAGKLQKTDDMVRGDLGKMEHQWRLNPSKYPSTQAPADAPKQQSLFL